MYRVDGVLSEEMSDEAEHPLTLLARRTLHELVFITHTSD